MKSKFRIVIEVKEYSDLDWNVFGGKYEKEMAAI